MRERSAVSQMTIISVIKLTEADQKLQNVNDGDATTTAHPKSVLIVLGMNSRHVGHTVTFPAHSGGGWAHQFFDGLLQGNIFEVQDLWQPLVGLLAARIQATVAEMENADERIGDDEQKADSVVFNEQESIQRVVSRFC